MAEDEGERFGQVEQALLVAHDQLEGAGLRVGVALAGQGLERGNGALVLREVAVVHPVRRMGHQPSVIGMLALICA